MSNGVHAVLSVPYLDTGNESSLMSRHMSKETRSRMTNGEPVVTRLWRVPSKSLDNREKKEERNFQSSLCLSVYLTCGKYVSKAGLYLLVPRS